MKTRIKPMIWLLAAMALHSAANVASAYYDPGVQRWINRDPLSEGGFALRRLGGHEFHRSPWSLTQEPIPGGDSAFNPMSHAPQSHDGPNPYVFTRNRPVVAIDATGLTTFVTITRKCYPDEEAACRSKCSETGMKSCTVVEVYVKIPGAPPPDNLEWWSDNIFCICNPKPKPKCPPKNSRWHW